MRLGRVSCGLVVAMPEGCVHCSSPDAVGSRTASTQCNDHTRAILVERLSADLQRLLMYLYQLDVTWCQHDPPFRSVLYLNFEELFGRHLRRRASEKVRRIGLRRQRGGGSRRLAAQHLARQPGVAARRAPEPRVGQTRLITACCMCIVLFTRPPVWREDQTL